MFTATDKLEDFDGIVSGELSDTTVDVDVLIVDDESVVILKDDDN